MKFIDWERGEDGEPVILGLIDISQEQLGMLVDVTQDLNDLPESNQEDGGS